MCSILSSAGQPRHMCACVWLCDFPCSRDADKRLATLSTYTHYPYQLHNGQHDDSVWVRQQIGVPMAVVRGDDNNSNNIIY